MPNLNAALGVAQLERLDAFLDAKRALADRYRNAFADIAGVEVFTEPDGARSNYWLNVLLLDDEDEAQIATLLQRTNDAGMMTRPVWTLMHELPMYRESPRMDLPTSESLSRRLLNLPSSVGVLDLAAETRPPAPETAR